MRKYSKFLILFVLLIFVVTALPSDLTVFLNSPTNVTYNNNLTRTFISNETSNVSLMNSTLSLWDSSNVPIIKYNLCYQETTNKSTVGDGSCILNYSGNYTINQSINPGYFNINYSKPLGVTNTSLWQVKMGNKFENLTIPSSCWNYNPSLLLLRLTSSQSNYNATALCSNSTGWVTLDDTAGASSSSCAPGGFGCSVLGTSDWSRLFDGDWNTYNVFLSVNTSPEWDYRPGSTNGLWEVYEEAMWWNITTPQPISISGTINQSTLSYTFPESGTYYWNNYVCDINQCLYNSTNYTLIIDTIYPNITFNLPLNNSYSTNDFIILNFSVNDTNFKNSTTYLYNQTDLIISITNSTQNVTYNFSGLPYTTYYVNITSFDLAGNSNSSETRQVTLATTAIVSPQGTFSSPDNLNFTVITNIANLSNCLYWISTSGGILVQSNTSLTCGTNMNGSFGVPFVGTTYNFNYFQNTTGNIKTFLVKPFIVSLPPQGGATSLTILGNVSWSMTTETGTKFYDLFVSPGTVRNKDIVFNNKGGKIETLTINCVNVNGSICQYVKFSQTTVTLPISQIARTFITMTIDIPKDIPIDTYTFNIVAIDGDSHANVVTTTIRTPGFFSSIFTKLLSSTNVFGINLPYLLIFIVFVGVILIIETIAFPKTDITIKAIFSIIISLLLMGTPLL